MNFILAKSGNAWLRHLKKTPRESPFSRVLIHAVSVSYRSFSTGRRPVCVCVCATGSSTQTPVSLQFPIAPSFLSPFLFNRIFTIYFRSTDLESLIRIHSRTPYSNPYFFYIQRVVQRVETFVEFEATKWIVSRRGGK